jgi:ABC-type multidrug transport system ATPase subunit
MMQIDLNNAGKCFNKEWIFKNFSFQFDSNKSYVILGGNGSGKSTLLQAIAGNYIMNQGAISYQLNQENISTDIIYKYVSFASPYISLLEEFTLTESLSFHQKFKPFIKNLSVKDVLNYIELKDSDKILKNYSSGMKMRVRLALAILSDTPLLLLDEPTSNLDKKSIDWYQNLVKEFSSDRLIIVASNHQQQEYFFCTEEINIEDYK